MFYILIHERNPVITFVPQCFSIYSTGRYFEFHAAIFTIHISIKGDASFPGTRFPIATFLGTKFRVRVGIRVSARVMIMVCGLDYVNFVTAIVLPGIAIPGIVRNYFQEV